MNVSTRSRFVLAVGLVLGITALHYSTAIRWYHLHEIFRRLYYIPIILSAFWFGIWGGVLSGMAVSVLYLPHVVFQWGGDLLSNLTRFSEILLYNVIGAITGLLVQAERRQRTRYEQASREVEASYRKLQAQTEQIMELEDQLRAADRLSVIGELSAGLAHEIRNPLASIKGTAEILMDFARVHQDEEAEEFVGILSTEVNRLEEVLRTYLQFARGSRLSLQRWAIGDIVQDAVALLGTYARRRKVEIRVEAEEDLHAEADRNLLIQALLNVFLNAVRASPPGATVSISAGSKDGEIFVECADHGEGIPPAHIPKIFDPLFSTREEGTGLGLTITKRIVERHHGRIEVKSQEGEGTTFTLLFPSWVEP